MIFLQHKLRNFLFIIFICSSFISYSQSVTDTVNWSGGWCSICGGLTGNYVCYCPWATVGCTLLIQKPFSDQVPNGNIVTKVSVTVYYINCSFNSLIVQLNGITIDTVLAPGTCNCGDCFTLTALRSAPCFPGYNYGGSNMIKLIPIGGDQEVCVSMAVITLDYSPSSPPSAPAGITGQTNPCTSSAQTYAISSVPGASYNWTVPAGWTINSGQGDTLITVTAGTDSGNVCVQACDSCECSAFSCLQVVLVALSIYLGNDTTICQGDTLTLDAGNPGATYLWQDSSISQVYDLTATEQYYVEVTDTNGCTNSDTINIWVDTLFNATITPAGPFCTIDAPVNFTAADSGGVWTGTGITNAIAGTFDPAAAGTGTHQITYTISGICGDADTTYITVNQNPTVNLGSDTSFCQGDTLTLDADNLGAAYLWRDSSASQIYAVFATGQYYVKVTNSNSCVSSDTVNVFVEPVADATINPVGPFCLTDSATTLTAANSGGLWSGNGITGIFSDIFDPTLAGSGTHQIVYNISGPCGDTDTTYITVNPAYLTNTPDETICDGDSVLIFGIYRTTAGTYYDSLTTVNGCDSIIATTLKVNPTYNISDLAVAICTGDSVSIYGTYRSVTGTYYDSLMTVNSCDSIHSTNIWVDTAFDATITPSGPFCNMDGSVMLTSADSGGVWSGIGITNVNAGTFDPAVAGTGTHQIICTIPGTCGDTDTTYITVNPTYSTNTPDQSICNGDSALIFGIYRTTAGTYYDSLSTINGCDSIIATTLTVNPLPTINLGPDTTICNGCSITLDAGAGFANYNWATGENTQTIIVDSAGAYIVDVSDTNGCVGTDTIVINISTGTNNQYSIINNQLKIYPNPNTGLFTLEIKLQKTTALSIRMYQIDGRLIYTKDLLNLQDLVNLTLNLSNHAKGIYYVQIVTGENVFTGKVIYQ